MNKLTRKEAIERLKKGTEFEEVLNSCTNEELEQYLDKFHGEIDQYKHIIV